jgi:hypothetical protein
LKGLEPRVPRDPFLWSIFFEKLLFAYSWEKTFHPEDGRTKWLDFKRLFRTSFEKSVQDTVLCEKYGRLLASEGEAAEAKRVLGSALRKDPGNPFLKDLHDHLSSAPDQPQASDP